MYITTFSHFRHVSASYSNYNSTTYKCTSLHLYNTRRTSQQSVTSDTSALATRTTTVQRTNVHHHIWTTHGVHHNSLCHSSHVSASYSNYNSTTYKCTCLPRQCISSSLGSLVPFSSRQLPGIERTKDKLV